MKVSECCGSYNIEYEDYCICPSCKEHCMFVEDTELEDMEADNEANKRD